MHRNGVSYRHNRATFTSTGEGFACKWLRTSSLWISTDWHGKAGEGEYPGRASTLYILNGRRVSSLVIPYGSNAATRCSGGCRGGSKMVFVNVLQKVCRNTESLRQNASTCFQGAYILSPRRVTTKWPPICSRFGSFLIAYVLHRFLPATSSFDDGYKFPATERAGQCSLKVECCHRGHEFYGENYEYHTGQDSFWFRRFSSYDD
ncbi:hypothetical protein BDM02DRAFT_389155 [Thelephora ganbajun]|uniref:Uncharacterized protein n=1 Tax=Thelephora ganbajun TaxID=370292 RepID=A0ACB6Z8Q3_THEGA|nr:hypothetical protein BDM02DRAFT_389155 [Thelephora ganbajun]